MKTIVRKFIGKAQFCTFLLTLSLPITALADKLADLLVEQEFIVAKNKVENACVKHHDYHHHHKLFPSRTSFN